MQSIILALKLLKTMVGLIETDWMTKMYSHLYVAQCTRSLIRAMRNSPLPYAQNLGQIRINI